MALKTLDIIKKYNIRPKKKWGQNFLVDDNILKKIIHFAQITKKHFVIEIGPGIGTLTEALCKAAGYVAAYEIDGALVEILRNELRFKNLKIINKDFLKANIYDDFDDARNFEEIIVVSNLPYYITTPVIFRLLEEEGINKMYFMMQREVGLRITSGPGSKDYGALSVLMEYKAISKILFSVSASCFYPKPEVESVFISVKKKHPELSVRNERVFLHFIKAIFSQRRKTLVNNISANYNIQKEYAMQILCKLGLKPTIRSEDLALRDIYNIYTYLFPIT